MILKAWKTGANSAETFNNIARTFIFTILSNQCAQQQGSPTPILIFTLKKGEALHVHKQHKRLESQPFFLFATFRIAVFPNDFWSICNLHTQTI